MKFLRQHGYIFVLLLVTLTAIAAKVGDDTWTLGRPGSSGDKEIILDVGDGASNPRINVDTTDKDFDFNKSMVIQGDSLKVGDGTNSNKTIELDVGNSPNNPFFQWDSSKNKLRFTNNGTSVFDIGSGSGGGGGENFNNAFTADNNANAEDGTTGWTASAGTFAATSTDPLEGEQSFTWTPAAQNDTLDSPVLDVDKDIFHGRACQAAITYIGGDENLTLQVIDADNDVLASESFEAGITLAGVKSIFFLCPQSSATANDKDLRLRILNEGASAAPLIKFDKSYVGTLIGLSESILPDHFSAFGSSDGTINSESTDFINGDCTDVGVGSYNCTFVSGVFNVKPSITCTPETTDGICSVHTITTGGFSVRTRSAAGSVTDMNWFVHVSKQGADAKQSVQVYKSIPKVSDNSNFFSAYFDTSSDTHDFENVPWIASVSNVSTGVSTINFTADLAARLTQAMSCVCVNNQGSGANNCNIAGSNTSGVNVYIANASGVAVDDDGFIHCSVQDDDYITPTVQPIIVGQVQSSEQSTSIRTESAEVACSSSSLIERELGSWLTSVTNVSSGSCTLTIDSGIFTEAPYCQLASTAGAAFLWVSAGATNTSVTFDCQNTAGSPCANYSAYITCSGK